MTYTRSWVFVLVTLLCAFILTLLPMPEWAAWMRPAWIVMTLIYWVTATPLQVNVGTAWLVGIFLDVLNGTILGEHAFALTLVAYFAARIYSRFRMFTVMQQGLWIFVFVLLYQFILFCIQGFIGDLPKSWLYWSPPLTSMLLWPWVFIIIRDSRRRFKVA